MKKGAASKLLLFCFKKYIYPFDSDQPKNSRLYAEVAGKPFIDYNG